MLPMVQPESLPFECGGPVDESATPSVALPPSVTPEYDDEFVDIFYDVDVALDSFSSKIESCDFQLGDTWRGMQGKMSVTTPVKKIRKKSDNKPQSQINKCTNEKKRRELENETINQLEELLETCLAEVKQPDKNSIVRQATQQIEEVLKRRRECPEKCPLRAYNLSPVQGGEVTSTQPQPPSSGLHYSELTTLIEALKHYTNKLGWVLLEINNKGEIECVTENIKDIVFQERTELYKKSIFSLIHASDHEKLRPLLKNVQTFSWAAAEPDKFQAIRARLLIKNTNGSDGDREVESVIHAAAVRGSSAEEAGSVMCVIRRCHDASAALLPADGGRHPPPAIVFRLDSNLNILSCDLSGVENNINFPINLTGTNYLELVDTCDRIRVAAHFQEAPCHPAPPAVSEPFRLLLVAEKPPFRVTAHSLLFRVTPTSGESDFIMSTHTVLSDDDVDLLDTGAPRPPVGGPLMTSVSVANGESSSTCETRYRSMSPAESQFGNEFDFDPWASPFQIGEMSCDDSKERKESNETPPTRAPSASVEAPPPTPPEEPNRLRSLLSKKPTGDATNSNNILKDLLKQEEEEASSSETSAPHTPHTPHTPAAAALSPLHSAQALARPHPARMPTPSHTMQHQQSHHNSDVLLRILNEKCDDDGDESRRNSMEGRSSQPSALLSQLLSNSNGPAGNGRTHEHDSYLDRMANSGVKRKFDDSTKTSMNPLKRPAPENQQVSSSAVSATSSTPSSTATSPSTSSSGMSPLCQKNQILVSLLARQQTTPTTPLPLPPSSRPAYPPAARPRLTHPPSAQQRHHLSTLSNMLTPSRASNVNGGMGGVSTGGGGECSGSGGGSGGGGQSHLQMVLQGAPRAQYPPPAPAPATALHQPIHYANTAPHHIYTNQPQPQSGSTRIASGNATSGDSEVPNDQTLSDILDEVIDNMPDAERPAPDVNVLGELEPRRTDYAGVKEKVINAIRQSLMQCEIPVSSSAAAPPVYPVQNQVSGGCTMSGSGVGAVYGAGAGAGGAEAGRARAIQEQQRARLLQLQRSQHMLVPPEAAEQPQADLGSTINALVSATPPNVALTRTDYNTPHHHLYHPPNQMAPNYGTNKITSSQQNPMLSRQLSGAGGSGYAGSGAGGAAAALHTPHSPAAPHPPHPHHPHLPHQPYHRAPRPHLVGGYYEEGGAGAGAGYCVEGGRRRLLPPHAAAPAPQPPHLTHPPLDHHLPCSGGGGVVGSGGGVAGGGAVSGGGTSEYVRNELRAVVGARARPDLHPAMQPDLDSLITFDMPNSGGGNVVGGRTGSAAASSWESQQSTPSTTEAVSAEATSAAGGDEAGGGAGRAAGSPADAKASLLQKLLSQ